jgi:predicted TIM-barrel fold metal-dependent hydrolase
VDLTQRQIFSNPATRSPIPEEAAMQLGDMILVSVDDHVCEPPDLFENHIPARWKDRAPRMVHRSDGTDVWVYEGQQVPNVGLNAVAGRPPNEYGIEPTALSQLRPGCYDVDARIGDMNANGVLGSLCFASMTGFTGELFNRCEDKELGAIMVRAYNDWHVDEWCGKHPGRFIPLGLPMMWSPELTAQEIRRLAGKGCHAITFPDQPSGLGLPSIHDAHWDPIWRACDETGTVVCIHIGSGTGMNLQDPGAAVEIMIAGTPITLFNCANELVFSDFLRRYPNLKIALSEGGAGWIPYFLERIDYVYRHHHAWTLSDFGDRLPSDVFREHVITCFIDDRAGVRNRDLIGVDTMTWECDYPHSDSTWPRSPEVLWESLEGVSDEDIDKITHGNAMRHFQYDPFAHIPREACSVASLRAEAKDVDTEPRSQVGGKKPSDYARGYCTIGDIMKQMAGAYAVPFDDAPTVSGK